MSTSIQPVTQRILLSLLLCTLFAPALAFTSSAASTASTASTVSSPAAALTSSTTSAVEDTGCRGNREANLRVCFTSPPSQGGHDLRLFFELGRLASTAGPGDRLRIVMFRWDLPFPNRKVIAAQERGARVELIVDDDVPANPEGAALVTAIEDGDPSITNVTVCQGACLPWTGPGPAPADQDVAHLKLFLFEIGGVRTVGVTSANIEGKQLPQFNNLLFVTDDGFYDYHSRLWERLKAQSWTVAGKTWGDKQRTYAGGPPATRAWVYPTNGDPVLDTLRAVTCVPGARSIEVAVAVIQRADVRRQLVALQQRGCSVKVIVTRDSIEQWLQAPIKAAGKEVALRPDRVQTGLHHNKIYLIHARLAGRVRHVVITGTSNATCGGLAYNDEVMWRLDDNWLWKRYRGFFKDLSRSSHQTQGSSSAKMPKCRL